MDKRKHHFVPRFYLGGFSSTPKRIHVFNLARRLPIRDASLRDQCYQYRLYGPTDELENELSVIENSIAPVAKSVLLTSELPDRTSEEHGLLLRFVALQLLRTPAAAARLQAGTDKITKAAFSGDPRLDEIDLDSLEFGYDQAVFRSLAHLEMLTEAVNDLKMHLISASAANRFIVSDNPVFKYNQYCEGVRYQGITGGLCRGLQMFLPLSTANLLMLYDGAVYKLGDRRTPLSVANEADMEWLNLLQVINAHENVYFSDWKQVDQISRLARRAMCHRRGNEIQVGEFVEKGDEDRNSILHSYERMPDLKLRLSFLTLRRDARRVRLTERVDQLRKNQAIPGMPDTAAVGRGRTVEFVRSRDREHSRHRVSTAWR